MTKYEYQIRYIFMIKIKERICLKEVVKERERDGERSHVAGSAGAARLRGG